MIDDRIILAAERLRDDLQELKISLRKRYSSDGIVAAEEIKRIAGQLAEKWIVEIGPNRDVAGLIAQQYLGDINVRFQRLLRFSEHSTKRSRYDAEIKQILKDFTVEFIVRLKQARASGENTESGNRTSAIPTIRPAPELFQPTAFVALSFGAADKVVNDCVVNVLCSLGISVVTGEKPKSDRISEKIKQRIDGQHIFVGVFTRRDKIAKKPEWTTSAWVIDEKAYAAGKSKKLMLLKENGVSSIGGLQGDYEYLEFSRDNLHDLVLKLIQIFSLKVDGLSE